jgi:hypothetical protein
VLNSVWATIKADLQSMRVGIGKRKKDRHHHEEKNHPAKKQGREARSREGRRVTPLLT